MLRCILNSTNRKSSCLRPNLCQASTSFDSVNHLARCSLGQDQLSPFLDHVSSKIVTMYRLRL